MFRSTPRFPEQTILSVGWLNITCQRRRRGKTLYFVSIPSVPLYTTEWTLKKEVLDHFDPARNKYAAKVGINQIWRWKFPSRLKAEEVVTMALLRWPNPDWKEIYDSSPNMSTLR